MNCSIRQAAESTGATIEQIRHWIRTGKLHAEKSNFRTEFGTKLLLVSTADVVSLKAASASGRKRRRLDGAVRLNYVGKDAEDVRTLAKLVRSRTGIKMTNRMVFIEMVRQFLKREQWMDDTPLFDVTLPVPTIDKPTNQ